MKSGIETLLEQIFSESNAENKIRALLKGEIRPLAFYRYIEVQTLLDISLATVTRAVQKGYLKASFVGSEPRLKGQDVLDWIDAGGKTGWSARDVRRKIENRAASRA